MNQTLFSNLPENRNFLSPIPFQLSVRRLPNTDYFLQGCNLPGITAQAIRQPTPFSDIPQPATKIEWKPFYATFKVDEDLNNWQEIFNWMVAVNLALDSEGYQALATNPYWSGLGITSEMILAIMDGQRQPNINVNFHYAFPLELTDLDFDATKTDVEYLTATATFAYQTYDMSSAK